MSAGDDVERIEPWALAVSGRQDLGRLGVAVRGVQLWLAVVAVAVVAAGCAGSKSSSWRVTAIEGAVFDGRVTAAFWVADDVIAAVYEPPRVAGPPQIAVVMLTVRDVDGTPTVIETRRLSLDGDRCTDRPSTLRASPADAVTLAVVRDCTGTGQIDALLVDHATGHVVGQESLTYLYERAAVEVSFHGDARNGFGGLLGACATIMQIRDGIIGPIDAKVRVGGVEWNLFDAAIRTGGSFDACKETGVAGGAAALASGGMVFSAKRFSDPMTGPNLRTLMYWDGSSKSTTTWLADRPYLSSIQAAHHRDAVAIVWGEGSQRIEIVSGPGKAETIARSKDRHVGGWSMDDSTLLLFGASRLYVLAPP